MGEARRDQITRLPWSRWHGQVDQALGKSDELATAIAPLNETYARCTPWLKAWSELRTSIVHNRHVSPHDGERDHHGEAIAPGFVESTVHDVVRKRCGKQQPMQCSKAGAHWL